MTPRESVSEDTGDSSGRSHRSWCGRSRLLDSVEDSQSETKGLRCLEDVSGRWGRLGFFVLFLARENRLK